MPTLTPNPGLCPELATPSPIITKENVHALKLSSYNRTHGTTVTISCLAAPDYSLVGANKLTCLDSGQWDKETPYCRMDVSISGGKVDISMLPMLVAAGSLGVLLLALVCIMIFVLCCWKQKGLHCHTHREHSSPIGLFRSLSLQEAESVFIQRRQRYEPSEFSDVIDSVSARCTSYGNTHGPDMQSRHLYIAETPRSSPTTYITAASRGTQQSFKTRMGSGRSYRTWDMQPRRTYSDATSRSLPTTYLTAVSRTPEPPLKIQVGTGQAYRTWHELFYT